MDGLDFEVLHLDAFSALLEVDSYVSPICLHAEVTYGY